mgnify:FL=1
MNVTSRPRFRGKPQELIFQVSVQTTATECMTSYYTETVDVTRPNSTSTRESKPLCSIDRWSEIIQHRDIDDEEEDGIPDTQRSNQINMSDSATLHTTQDWVSL